MSIGKINKRILDGIRENSEDDKVLENFLIEIILEEANHPGAWWWKETYKKKVDKYLKEWEGFDEN